MGKKQYKVHWPNLVGRNEMFLSMEIGSILLTHHDNFEEFNKSIDNLCLYLEDLKHRDKDEFLDTKNRRG